MWPSKSGRSDLLSATERGGGEVGGSDIRGVQACFTAKQPGFGVQARAPVVVGDFDLRVGQRRQQLDRGQLRGFGEHRGQHAQPEWGRARVLRRALREALECVAQQAHAAHGDERDQHIDAIGRGHFARELAAQVRLGAVAREQGAGSERRVRALVGSRAVNRA